MLEDIKLKEINIFLELMETQSVRELARRRGVQASQITKSVQSMEHKLGKTLLDRSIRGVTPTPQAQELLKVFREIQKQGQSLSGSQYSQVEKDFMTFATTSFLSTHLLPKAFHSLESLNPNATFRLFDLPPSQFISVGMRGGFHYCVHIGDLEWPKTWDSSLIGPLKWVLCCRKGHPLKNNPDLSEVLKYKFIYPVYWTIEGVKFGNDNCPLSISKRIKGHETATATAGAQLVKFTDHIGFLPDLVIREDVSRGDIRVLKVPSWEQVEAHIYLTVKSDQVKKSQRDKLLELLKKEL